MSVCVYVGMPGGEKFFPPAIYQGFALAFKPPFLNMICTPFFDNIKRGIVVAHRHVPVRHHRVAQYLAEDWSYQGSEEGHVYVCVLLVASGSIGIPCLLKYATEQLTVSWRQIHVIQLSEHHS